MNFLEKFKDELIFEVQKEFWNERGKGARYRLTRIGVDFAERELGEKIKDKENIKKWLIDNGFCEDIDITENEISMTMIVKNCSLLEIKNMFKKANIKPLSCPLANIFMYCLELNSGLLPELLPIEEDENGNCKVTLAKMATSEIVKR